MIFKRIRNLWKISGIEIEGVSPQAKTLTELSKVFTKDVTTVPEKRMATVFNSLVTNPLLDELPKEEAI